jgi:hypothetical protein
LEHTCWLLIATKEHGLDKAARGAKSHRKKSNKERTDFSIQATLYPGCFRSSLKGRGQSAIAIKPVSNPYRTDFMDLRIHDMDYGFTTWIYGSTDFMDFE